MDDAHKFALGLWWKLVMEAPQDVLRRLGVVILHEGEIKSGGLREGTCVEALEEEASFVAEDLRFDEQDVRDSRSGNDHQNTPPFKRPSRYCP